jgi:hypothetical protein
MFAAVGGTIVKTIKQSSDTPLLSVNNCNGEVVHVFKQFDFDHHRQANCL